MQTKHAGLTFKRSKDKHLNHLPIGDEKFIDENNIEFEFETPDKELISCCDASHATDHRTRKSTT